jgi:hypothetical protein
MKRQDIVPDSVATIGNLSSNTEDTISHTLF